MQYNPSIFYIPNFKPLAIFCGNTAMHGLMNLCTDSAYASCDESVIAYCDILIFIYTRSILKLSHKIILYFFISRVYI